MADYTVIYNDHFGSARATKNNTGWDLIQKEFHGGAYKQDAIRWLKQAGGSSATFELVSEAEHHRI